MKAIIGSQFPKIAKEQIENAKKSIKIIVYDWRTYFNDAGNPVQLFNQTLVRAALRGVEIKAIVNNDEILKFLEANKIKAKKCRSKGLIHAKLLLIDDEIIIIGSHNYTQNAFTMNQEVSALIDDKEASAKYRGYFEALWAL